MSIISIQLVTAIKFDTAEVNYADLVRDFTSMVAEINSEVPPMPGAIAISASAMDVTDLFNPVRIAG